MTLSDSIEEFILEQRCRGHSPRTFEYYGLVLRRFGEFAALEDLTDVDQLLSAAIPQTRIVRHIEIILTR